MQKLFDDIDEILNDHIHWHLPEWRATLRDKFAQLKAAHAASGGTATVSGDKLATKSGDVAAASTTPTNGKAK